MKTLLLITALMASAGMAETRLKEFVQPLDRIYIPKGYDNNDAVQFVVKGHFESSCVQLGYISSEVNMETHNVSLRVTAYRYPGQCTDFALPFHQVFYLGKLEEPGDYNVTDATTGKLIGILHIDKAPAEGTGTDSQLYAPLTDAFIDKGELVLRGLSPNSCLEIAVEFRPQKDALVVLPLATYEGTQCERGEFAFERRFKLSTDTPISPFLLHVRSNGGQSINKMVTP